MSSRRTTHVTDAHVYSLTLQWEMGILWSFDEEAQVVVREGVWSSYATNPADSKLRGKPITAPKSGLIERVWTTGDPAWSAKLNSADFSLPPISIKANVRGAGCFPIKSKGHILGANGIRRPRVKPVGRERS